MKTENFTKTFNGTVGLVEEKLELVLWSYLLVYVLSVFITKDFIQSIGHLLFAVACSLMVLFGCVPIIGQILFMEVGLHLVWFEYFWLSSLVFWCYFVCSIFLSVEVFVAFLLSKTFKNLSL